MTLKAVQARCRPLVAIVPALCQPLALVVNALALRRPLAAIAPTALGWTNWPRLALCMLGSLEPLLRRLLLCRWAIFHCLASLSLLLAAIHRPRHRWAALSPTWW